MDRLEIEGITIGEPIGGGGCGVVYRGVGLDGGEVAVKEFDAMAVNRSLLVRSARRLKEGGWPEGVISLIGEGFENRPPRRVTPLWGEESAGGWRPASLQHRLGEHPGEGSWDLVRRVAVCLEGMHKRRVAHGNLKPGNVMFDDGGRAMLTDWAMGNMPGVTRFQFTDALLYQPPEQLRDNDGYLEEEGYRWDVFAFGVLSFKLLTGKFPRCDEIFEGVCPPPGETRREGVDADLEKVASALEAHGDVKWPDESANRLEGLLREIIGRCLEIDPFQRPGSMIEVLGMIEDAEKTVAAEQEREAILDQRRRMEKRLWRTNIVAGVVIGVAVALGALLFVVRSQLDREQKAHREDVRNLADTAADAEKRMASAEKDAGEARRTLARESDRWLARLKASRTVGDQLFEWAMEAGDRRLPALEGREARLKKLAENYREFLERTKGEEALSAERARAMLQLAEISLAAGDAEDAAARLDEALAAWKGMEAGPDWQLRVAADRVLYALLREKLGGAEVSKDIAAARQALEKLPKAQTDRARVKCLLAVLDLAAARDFSRRNQDAMALGSLTRAAAALNELAEERPDAVAIQSQLASSYLSTAGILEGMAKFSDAREARMFASEELWGLLKKDPSNPELRSELAGTYGAMAEAAVVDGDVATAAKLSAEATKILEKLHVERPGDVKVAVRLAAQRGVAAGLRIDRGESAEAMKLIEDGIRLLDGAPAAASPMARYRLALLQWQKARLLGVGGKPKNEVLLEQSALEALRGLQGDAVGGPSTEQIRRSMAYLLGDLAHAAETTGDRKTADKYYADSVGIWELLNRARPGYEEYEEGLSWSRERLKVRLKKVD
jgi:hypothetical protein